MSQEAIQFEAVNEREFEKYPDKPPKKADKWDPVMDQIEAGKVIRLSYGDDKERRNIQLALGRKGASRQFKVETRFQDGTLVARKSSEPYVPKPAAPKNSKAELVADPS